jgi:hypothetical protein
MMPPRVISVHFPKAAGSSLWAQFARLLGDKAALDITHDPFTLAGSESAEFPVEKALVHGHFRAGRYESTDAYWMTFLRHPVDNLISIYFYWKSLKEPGHSLHARFLVEAPSILEFAWRSGFSRLGVPRIPSEPHKAISSPRETGKAHHAPRGVGPPAFAVICSDWTSAIRGSKPR